MRKLLSQMALVVAAVIVVALASVGLAFNNHNPDAEIVFGKTELSGRFTTATRAESADRPAWRVATVPVKGNGDPIPYQGRVVVPKDLKFFLVVGSDARPGQDVVRQRADSIHIAAIDPQTREGTIVGLPRDSYVDIPGHGRSKINAAMAYGGPDLLVETVRNLTGFPIEYWAIASFNALEKITNTLKGVDINVPYDMDDSYSGARFTKGWHHMNGAEVLSFSRARHGVPNGDFGRSENQGRVIKHALEKMRHEVRNEDGVRNWLKILYQYGHLSMSMKDAFDLAKLARQIAPSDLKNVVAAGDARMVGSQSVVVLSDQAYALFKDVRADAQADGNEKRGAPRPMPTPKPTPKASSKPVPHRPRPTPKQSPLIQLPTLPPE